MGLKHTVDVLRGSKAAKVIQKGHDKLRAYGKGMDKPAEYWLALGKQMTQHGYFQLSDDGYSTLTITKKAIRAVKDKERIVMVLPALKPVKEPKVSPKGAVVECDEGLFQKLRQLRKELADAAGVPPYVIFGDVSLRGMAAGLPTTDSVFLAISGVGQRKLSDYGEAFMEVIRQWIRANGGEIIEEEEEPQEVNVDKPKKEKLTEEMKIEMNRTNGRPDRHGLPFPAAEKEEVFDKFRDGKPVPEIAAEHKRSAYSIAYKLAQNELLSMEEAKSYK